MAVELGSGLGLYLSTRPLVRQRSSRTVSEKIADVVTLPAEPDPLMLPTTVEMPDGDIVDAFIDARVRPEPKATLSAAALYRALLDHCAVNNVRAVPSAKRLGQVLARRGFVRQKKGGKMSYAGVRLIAA